MLWYTNCDESVIGLDGAKRFGKSARFFAASVCQQVTGQHNKKSMTNFIITLQYKVAGPDLEPVSKTMPAENSVQKKKEKSNPLKKCFTTPALQELVQIMSLLINIK